MLRWILENRFFLIKPHCREVIKPGTVGWERELLLGRKQLVNKWIRRHLVVG